TRARRTPDGHWCSSRHHHGGGLIATRVESCHDTTVAAPTVATRRPTEAPFPGVAPTATVIKRVASTVPSRSPTPPRAACTAAPVLIPHGADPVPVTRGMSGAM